MRLDLRDYEHSLEEKKGKFGENSGMQETNQKKKAKHIE